MINHLFTKSTDISRYSMRHYFWSRCITQSLFVILYHRFMQLEVDRIKKKGGGRKPVWICMSNTSVPKTSFGHTPPPHTFLTYAPYDVLDFAIISNSFPFSDDRCFDWFIFFILAFLHQKNCKKESKIQTTQKWQINKKIIIAMLIFFIRAKT